MDNNYLFLAMQTGGQLSPEQLQRAQQMGQLPQMNMGAGLNDIQKKNMQEAQHYNMFRRGGVPRMYAQGGEQEEIDQQYLSPYAQYNQRVSDFLQNLRSTSMNALQDEMVGVNDEYAEEADQIEMEQAQYGQQVSQATVNPQGMAAVNSWMGAAQNTKDLTQPLAQTAGLATGLKGYFGGDQASYEANPYNSAWNPTRLTVTNKDTGDKTVTRAGRDGFNYGGQYFAPGGSISDDQYAQAEQTMKNAAAQGWGTDYIGYKNAGWLPKREYELKSNPEVVANAKAKGWGDDVTGYEKAGWVQKEGTVDPNALPTSLGKKKEKVKAAPAAATTTKPTAEEVKKAEEEKKKADEAKGTDPGKTPATTEEEKKKAEADAKAKEEAKTTATTTETKKNTGEVDYLGMMADPTGQNAGGVYNTDRNGNPVPMAFYDPNMRLTGMKADYRNNAASWFRKNKRPGQMKSLSFDFTTGTQSPATQVPSITGPNVPTGPGPKTANASPNDVTLAPGVTRPDLMPQTPAEENFFETGLLPKQGPEPSNEFSPLLPGQSPSANPVPNQTNRFFPKAPASTNTSTFPGGPFPAGDNAWMDEWWKDAAANWRPGMKWDGPQEMLPSSIRQTPAAAPGSATQSMIPSAQSQNQALPQTLSPRQERKQIRQEGRQERRSMIEEANRKAIEQIQNAAAQGYAYGGQYFAPGGENQEVLGLTPNPQMDMGWAPVGQTNVEMSQDFNKQKYGEPLKINDTDKFTAKYDKNKKDNPFFAPAMLAGLDLVAGAAQNRDAKKKENQLRGKLSYDQIYSANPETSGSRGDWTFNEGYMRPNDMVPTQFTGAGQQMQWGGAYAEGDELYLDEDAIQAFLQAGGQLDYLD
jgi:hypothetical protein